MNATYRTPEHRRKEAEVAYHNACIAQYRESVAKLSQYPKMAQRAADNALFHERKLSYLLGA